MRGAFYKNDLLSGYALIAFIGAACVMALLHLQTALAGLETPALQDMVQGKWAAQFEKTFREALPVNAPSRNFWGSAEYAAFHQGRKGVIIGTHDWLFTDEEFSCPPHSRENLEENLSYITATRQALAQKNIRLAIVLVPAKARILPEYLGASRLPACRNSLYADAYNFLVKNGVAVTDVLSVMRASPVRESLYLKTDTHWSPAGAKLAAVAAASVVHNAFKDMALPASGFSVRAGGVKDHAGDLASYVPGVAWEPEHITSYISGVDVASTEPSQNLFGDAAPPVTLVGTSYSANPNWNFEGFLKESLKADVLNMADQGQGPFVVMDKYLQDDVFKQGSSRLVVWEMPERYLLMPHGAATAAK